LNRNKKEPLETGGIRKFKSLYFLPRLYKDYLIPGQTKNTYQMNEEMLSLS